MRRYLSSFLLAACVTFNGPAFVNEGNVPESERPVINETNVLPGTWFHFPYSEDVVPCKES
jgi:hypothetical protein